VILFAPIESMLLDVGKECHWVLEIFGGSSIWKKEDGAVGGGGLVSEGILFSFAELTEMAMLGVRRIIK
jgi:hypothetical protein